MKIKYILPIVFLLSIITVSAVQSEIKCDIYDDFSSSSLDLTRWEETLTRTGASSYVESYGINLENQIYSTIQSTPSDRGIELKSLHEFKSGDMLGFTFGMGDILEFDLNYNSGSGNHWGCAFWDEMSDWNGGLTCIGHWNEQDAYSGQYGTYHYKAVYVPNGVEINRILPDGTTEEWFINTIGPPSTFSIVSRTGSDGTLNFDYDNFKICHLNYAPEIRSLGGSFQNYPDKLEFTHGSTDANNDPLSYSWVLDGVEQANTQNWTYYSPTEEKHVVELIISDGSLETNYTWNLDFTPIQETTLDHFKLDKNKYKPNEIATIFGELNESGWKIDLDLGSIIEDNLQKELIGKAVMLDWTHILKDGWKNEINPYNGDHSIETHSWDPIEYTDSGLNKTRLIIPIEENLTLKDLNTIEYASFSPYRNSTFPLNPDIIFHEYSYPPYIQILLDIDKDGKFNGLKDLDYPELDGSGVDDILIFDPYYFNPDFNYNKWTYNTINKDSSLILYSQSDINYTLQKFKEGINRDGIVIDENTPIYQINIESGKGRHVTESTSNKPNAYIDSVKVNDILYYDEPLHRFLLDENNKFYSKSFNVKNIEGEFIIKLRYNNEIWNYKENNFSLVVSDYVEPSPSSGGSSSGGGGSHICVEKWECSAWGACKNQEQTRTCVDTSNCGTKRSKPDTIKVCVVKESFKEENKEAESKESGMESITGGVIGTEEGKENIIYRGIKGIGRGIVNIFIGIRKLFSWMF